MAGKFFTFQQLSERYNGVCIRTLQRWFPRKRRHYLSASNVRVTAEEVEAFETRTGRKPVNKSSWFKSNGKQQK